MCQPGTQFGHVVAVLHMLAGKEIELVQVLVIGLNNNAALCLLHMEHRLEHDAGAFLDELAHGVQVGRIVHAGGEDAGAVLAF